jgi:hypothetical protein
MMADRGCVALDWDHEAESLPADAPIVVLMPGEARLCVGCLRCVGVCACVC